jgi:hypothetical protein
VQFELAAEGYRQHGPLPARIAQFEEIRLHAHDFESDCGRLKLSTPQRAIQTFCNKARFNRMGLYDDTINASERYQHGSGEHE